jgi:hypothetical protein
MGIKTIIVYVSFKCFHTACRHFFIFTCLLIFTSSFCDTLHGQVVLPLVDSSWQAFNRCCWWLFFIFTSCVASQLLTTERNCNFPPPGNTPMCYRHLALVRPTFCIFNLLLCSFPWCHSTGMTWQTNCAGISTHRSARVSRPRRFRSTPHSLSAAWSHILICICTFSLSHCIYWFIFTFLICLFLFSLASNSFLSFPLYSVGLLTTYSALKVNNKLRRESCLFAYPKLEKGQT